jgi:hypothetical protein
MTDPVAETIAIANAQERLRQERETFDQRRTQNARWFIIQQVMAWIAVVFLPGIALPCGWIIFHNSEFAAATVTVATSALLVDAFGFIFSIWKIVLGSGPTPLEPVTVAVSKGELAAGGQGDSAG